MKVLKPGLLTTIQDLGRYHYQKYGVIISGGMDSFALRISNLIVGNEEDEAVLEITLQGPTLQFEEEISIAICGASLSPTLDGEAVPEWGPIRVKKGSILSFGEPLAGCRSYLAVSGGFVVPEVMESKSTFLRAGIGGAFGRALMAGDSLHVRKHAIQRPPFQGFTGAQTPTAGERSTSWFVSSNVFPHYAPEPVVRFIRGREFDLFSRESQRDFLSEAFLVTPSSDRMGYRLSGPALSLKSPVNLLSSAVVSGTVQVPSDGQPILLMSDHQTTGGYPMIAHVITVDLPVLAQMKPGDKVRFAETSIEEAHSLIRQEARGISMLKWAIQRKAE